MQAAICLDTLAATALCASTEETRYYLRGVCVDIQPRATIYVATDGHRLFARRIELNKDAPDNTLTGVYIVPTESCAKPFKRTKHSPSDAILHDAGDGRLRIEYDAREHGFRPIDGTFPDWRRVLPSKVEPDPKQRIALNPSYMQTFDRIGAALAARPLNGGKRPVTYAQFHDGGAGPWGVTFVGLQDCFGVVMPIRVPAVEPWSRPTWVRAADAPSSVPELKKEAA